MEAQLQAKFGEKMVLPVRVRPLAPNSVLSVCVRLASEATIVRGNTLTMKVWTCSDNVDRLSTFLEFWQANNSF